MIIAETSFNQAIQNFKEFLADNNLPTEILWVFQEDTVQRNNEFYETNFWLKLPLPEENEKFAEAHYKIGQRKNLGVSLYAFAICEDKICCSFVVPKDKEDSEYLFMSPKYLKFTFSEDLPKAQPVRSLLQWKLFTLLPFKYIKGCFMVYLQSKNDLQF